MSKSAARFRIIVETRDTPRSRDWTATERYGDFTFADAVAELVRRRAEITDRRLAAVIMRPIEAN